MALSVDLSRRGSTNSPRLGFPDHTLCTRVANRKPKFLHLVNSSSFTFSFHSVQRHNVTCCDAQQPLWIAITLSMHHCYLCNSHNSQETHDAEKVLKTTCSQSKNATINIWPRALTFVDVIVFLWYINQINIMFWLITGCQGRLVMVKLVKYKISFGWSNG